MCASQAHTLSMGDAISAFPDAKVVGPEFAQEKLKYAKMLKKVKTVDKNNNVYVRCSKHTRIHIFSGQV